MAWSPVLIFLFLVVLAIVAAVRISLARKTAWPLVLVLLGVFGMFAFVVIFTVRTSHVETPPQFAGPGPVQIYTDGSPVPPMAPMAPMAPGAPKMPSGTLYMEDGMGHVSIGHPPENTVNLVADPSAWRPEVEELYRANLYSSSTSAARSLGQRLRQQLAKLPESERPKRVYVVSPEGPGDIGTTATVQLAASEIARQLRQLSQLEVELIPSAKSVRGEWAAAAATTSKAIAAPTASSTSTGAAPVAAESPVFTAEVPATESLSASDESSGAGETPVTPAPPAPEADPSSSSDESDESDAAIVTVDTAETSAAEPVAAGAEVSRPADVDSLASDSADAASAGAGTNGGGLAESPSDAAAVRVPYLVEIDLVDFSVQKPGNWGMDSTSMGTLRASLESPGTLYDQEVRFYDKPWVDREDEFIARNPRGSFVVVRSELMVSPEEARQQNQRLLGDYMYQRLLSANQLNPGLVQPNQLIECEALQTLVQDRFVQQLDGPAGEPVWREAMLVRVGAPGEPNALSQWVQQRQMEQQVVQHHEQVRRRSIGAQILVLLGGIAGLYTMLNAATQGYFTGRLRAVAVVAVVLALLGFFMIS